jgi:hypothetical protein
MQQSGRDFRSGDIAEAGLIDRRLLLSGATPDPDARVISQMRFDDPYPGDRLL